ncbi:hypothetical protein OsI_35321 [Oryza sativa Indica Group]|uniref:CASP-like protein n=2 Tax=Oryza TaxID=4527 RepID=A0A0E0IYV2_ORYNI|nr:hypothetical protein OsI_35321 [Oryza sativa Indica Group]
MCVLSLLFASAIAFVLSRGDGDGNAEAVASDLRLPLPCTAAVSRDKAATLFVLLRVSSLLLAVVAAAAHSHLASSMDDSREHVMGLH